MKVTTSAWEKATCSLKRAQRKQMHTRIQSLFTNGKSRCVCVFCCCFFRGLRNRLGMWCYIIGCYQKTTTTFACSLTHSQPSRYFMNILCVAGNQKHKSAWSDHPTPIFLAESDIPPVQPRRSKHWQFWYRTTFTSVLVWLETSNAACRRVPSEAAFWLAVRARVRLPVPLSPWRISSPASSFEVTGNSTHSSGMFWC